MIEKICPICNNKFSIFPYRIKTAEFCSYKCMGISKRCKSISADTQFKEGHTSWNKGKKIDRTKYPKYGNFKKHSQYSKDQMSKNKKGKKMGDKHPNWNGGEIIQQGYRWVKLPNHPNRNKNGYVAKHYLVMEEKLGFYPKSGQIHHIDNNKLNNSPENLVHFETISSHCKCHRQLESLGYDLYNSGKIKFSHVTKQYYLT